MKHLGVLNKWSNNAKIISQMMEPSKYIFKTIFCFDEIQIWKEIFDFYAKNVFPCTNKKLSITLDEFDSRMQSPPVLKFVNKLVSSYPESVIQKKFHRTAGKHATHYEMATSLSSSKPVPCPSGSLYFKINVDGDIMPCDKVGGFLADKQLVLGNTKKRQLYYFDNLFSCPTVQGPCCIKQQDESFPSRIEPGQPSE